MSERPVKIILQDILDAVEKIISYTKGMGEEQFIANQIVKDAVIRNLEIIGEATNRLPEDFFGISLLFRVEPGEVETQNWHAIASDCTVCH